MNYAICANRHPEHRQTQDCADCESWDDCEGILLLKRRRELLKKGGQKNDHNNKAPADCD